ncbi:MAG: MBL fold metallo-hydrolase [Deltaproteobacteria bacterium]|nr:MBL fold metallo-hydrolase [Deltaproteobacteria bacterium]
MSSARNDADVPDGDVLEISLFGPGYGESILAYTGEGDWLVVDSCVTSDRKTPAALAYLAHIGVDPSTAVKLVVATHWHDDHIRGLAALYRACTSARFVCSQALKNEDFLTLSKMAGERSLMKSSGVDEFNAILAELERRRGAPRWAMADRVLWSRGGAVPCKVWALSPSDGVVTRAFRSFSRLLQSRGSPKKRIPAPERNQGSVAILLSVGSKSILLGADLEAGREDRGWAAVLATHAVVEGKSKIYKVAHHGSESADNPQIWTDLLLDQPIAILTPFSRGNVHLPTESDIQRIEKRTRYLYSTARVASRRARRTTGSVARTKREVMIRSHGLVRTPGHVRVRMNIHEPLGRVDLYDGAISLGAACAGNVA